MAPRGIAVALTLVVSASAQRYGAKAKYGQQSGGKQHAVTQTCPKGYYLDGSKCISKQEVAEELSCPSGSVERDGQCLDFSAGRWTCPTGLTLVGRTCVGKESADKIRQCPVGSIAQGSECVILGNYPFECPEDAVMENGQCSLIMPKIKQCPGGFASIGDLCLMRESTEPERYCPTGTLEQGNQCTVTTTVEQVCPDGYEDLGSSCARYQDQVQRCPNGFRPAGSWCSRVDRVEKQVECANGQDPGSNCAVKVDVPLTPFCETGKMWNGQCAMPSFGPASYQCPSGYQQNGSSCVKTVSYDCSTTEHDIECDEQPTGKGAHLRVLGAETAKDKYQTAQYSKRHNLPVCHKVPRTVAKTCEKTLSAQAEAYCTNGTLKSNNQCEIINYTAPSLKCDASSGSNGECYVMETSAPLRSCPAGYTNTGSQCVKTITAAPEWLCPRGTSGSDCATYADKVCPSGETDGTDDCQVTHVEKAKYICPDGYADKVLRCPVDAEERDGLTCAQYIKGMVEELIRRVQAQTMCPSGYADNGSGCIRRVVQAASFTCPNNSSADSSYSCVNPVAKISACPKGSTSLKDRCWVISQTEPISVDTVVPYHK